MRRGSTPPVDGGLGTSTESADAVAVSADVHELRFEVPSDFTGIDVVTVNVSAGGEDLSVGLVVFAECPSFLD